MAHPGHPVGTICVIVAPLYVPVLGRRVRVVGGTDWQMRRFEPGLGSPEGAWWPTPAQRIKYLDYPDSNTPDTMWPSEWLRPIDKDTAADDETIYSRPLDMAHAA